MTAHKPTAQRDTSPQVPYRPPERLLAPCPQCGCVVRLGVALPGGTIQRLDPPQFPVTGRAHDCDEALAMTLSVHGLRWNAVQVAQVYEAYRDTLRESAAAKEKRDGQS